MGTWGCLGLHLGVYIYLLRLKSSIYYYDQQELTTPKTRKFQAIARSKDLLRYFPYTKQLLANCSTPALMTR